MKAVLVILCLTVIAGCSTVAGTVKGLGEDVKQGTDYVADMVKPQKVKQ